MLPFRLETRSINWKGTLCFKCTFSRSSSHMLWNGTLVSNQHVKWWIKPNFKLLLDNCFKKSIKCSIQTISRKVFPYFLQGNSKLWTWHSGRKISWWILFFCMVDWWKAFSLISSWGHFQRSSPSRISYTLRVGFKPVQNLMNEVVQ